MKIMSANLCSWGQGQLSKPARMPRVQEVLAKYEPDLIGVQESTADWSAFLKETLTAYGCTGIGREPGKYDECCHIFYRKEQFDLLAEENFWLSDTPQTMSMGWDAACTRICTKVLLQEKATGKQFAYFNTHLDHVGATAQTKGAALVTQRMAAVDAPILLSGDFNVTCKSDAYKTFAAALQDTRSLCGMQNTGGSYHDYGKVSSMETEDPIDHIFVSKHWSVDSYALIKDKIDQQFVSDHYFVLVQATLV